MIDAQAAWLEALAPYYAEAGCDPPAAEALAAKVGRVPFDAGACGAVEWCSATTVAEAQWLLDRDVDAIIAQGHEAGGHRGCFLGDCYASPPDVATGVESDFRCTSH